MSYIFTFKDKPNKQLMGGKAFALSKLNNEFAIPEWFVITPRAFFDSLNDEQKNILNENRKIIDLKINEDILESICNNLNKILVSADDLFAVRSSALSEDSELSSFAGQFESYLNVPKKEIIEKIICVWNSGFKNNVRRYQENTKIDSGLQIPAVIIQRMVKAKTAGVAFSIDPVTGAKNTCIIVSTKGLADKLVSGEVNGDTFHINHNGNVLKSELVSDTPTLSKEELNEVLKSVLKSERFFKKPQDIEWAFEGDKFYLLQSRPITTLDLIENEKLIVWDNSNIVESYSGITSPLTFSFARHVYEQVYIQFCKIMGVSDNTIKENKEVFANMLGYINGYVYYNLLNWYKVLALFPGFNVNRKFMEQMMGVRESLPDELVNQIKVKDLNFLEKFKEIVRLINTIVGLLINAILIHIKVRDFYNRLNKLLASPKTPIEKMSLDKLADYYIKLEKNLIDKWDTPLINDFFCMIAFGTSKKILKNYLGDNGESLHNDLMIGQGNIVSTEPAKLIKKMAITLSKDKDLIETIFSNNMDLAIEKIKRNEELKYQYENYIERFGDRCLQELKLESITLHDDPSTLLYAVASLAKRNSHEIKVEENREKNQELKNLLNQNPIKYLIAKGVIAWAKFRVRNRENLRFERTRVFGRIRKIFLEIGKRFEKIGILENCRDVFYLEIFEILGSINGTSTINDIKKLIAIRKKDEERYKLLAPLPNRFETRGAVLTYLNNNSHRISAVAQVESTSINKKKGLGCCPGIVKAKVRVITDPKNAKLNQGEIMVALHTDPGWITLFTNASGILVERGSLLSHSAIVSRELGIPAIVAIENVTSWLKDGDEVEMNGSTGEILLLNRN